jgi:hypothetical protein
MGQARGHDWRPEVGIGKVNYLYKFQEILAVVFLLQRGFLVPELTFLSMIELYFFKFLLHSTRV